MRRSTALQSLLAVSSAVALWPLANAALAGAPMAAPPPTPGASAGVPAPAAASTAAPGESAIQNKGPAVIRRELMDGDDEFGIPASSHQVRAMLTSRPKEDLIICIAGCRPGDDRVVFARTADPERIA
ncbi:MAG: hypothetical protein ACRCS9_14340, partial [Hyphomicrobium sp.]